MILALRLALEHPGIPIAHGGGIDRLAGRIWIPADQSSPANPDIADKISAGIEDIILLGKGGAGLEKSKSLDFQSNPSSSSKFATVKLHG